MSLKRDSTFQSMYESATALGIAAASSRVGAIPSTSTRLVPRTMLASTQRRTSRAASTISFSVGFRTLPFASGRNSA